MLVAAGAALQCRESGAIRLSALVVENGFLGVLALALALEQAGIEVAGVLRLDEEAVKAVAKLCPNVVVMDVRLAGRMDGIEAARIIRRRWQGPILFHTAETDMAAREVMAALGVLAPRLAAPRQVAAIVASLASAGSCELAGQPLGDATYSEVRRNLWSSRSSVWLSICDTNGAAVPVAAADEESRRAAECHGDDATVEAHPAASVRGGASAVRWHQARGLCAGHGDR